MIQRKQSLFLIQLIVLALVLFFIPCVHVIAGGVATDISLLPVSDTKFSSAAGHYAAIAINGLSMSLCIIVLFLFRKRELQRTLCFLLAALWTVLTLMIAFCPLVEGHDTPISTSVNPYAILIGILGTFGALLAARFIKKDIELLKSAERIR